MATAFPDTRVARTTDRILALPTQVGRRPRTAFAALIGLATLVFFAHLGSSAFFMDEIFSWDASRQNFGQLFIQVRNVEVTPPLYYVLLHLWLDATGASDEAMMRLPSAVAGVGLVAAVAWLGTIVGDRRVGLTAGALTALSPLVLSYAQMVRSYVFVMLAVTITVAAVIRLTQEPEQRRWLVLSIAAGATSIMLHYTAGLVFIPLGLWLLRAREVHIAARLAVIAGFAAPTIALMPLLADQMAQGHHANGATTYARITSTGMMRLIATPFDGRAILNMMPSYQLGFVALVDAVALLAMMDRFRTLRTRWVLVGMAVFPVAMIVVISALVNPFAITRYTAVATPFMLVVVALVAWRVPRVLGFGMLAAAFIASGLGIAAANTPTGRWPDVRSATAYVGENSEKGDVFAGLTGLQYGGSNTYYEERYGVTAEHFNTPEDALTSPSSRTALRSDHAVFLAAWPPIQDLRETVERSGFTVRNAREFGGGTWPVEVLEVVR